MIDERALRVLAARVREASDEGGVVYAMGIVGHDRVKIGRTRDPRQRLSHVQVGCPWEVVLVAVVRGGHMAEDLIQSALRHTHIRGEWYEMTHDAARAVFLACGGGEPEAMYDAWAREAVGRAFGAP